MTGPSSRPPFDRVALVGLGLVGGSIGLAIRRAWPGVSVRGLDRREVVEEALRRSVIDEAREGIADLRDADLVVMAAPVPVIIEQLAEVARAGLDAVVTDVGSTKRAVMTAAADARLPAFVGGHPIAGAEQGGLRHARSDLFDSRPWLLVPGAAASTGSVHRVERFVRGLGAVSRELDATTHDRVMAYVSHVPQLVSSALMASAGEAVGEAGLLASGRAFAEMTRLASSPADVWQGILATNADFIAEALGALAAGLPLRPAALDDRQRIERVFGQARAWRDRLAAFHPSIP